MTQHCPVCNQIMALQGEKTRARTYRCGRCAHTHTIVAPEVNE